MVNPKKAFDDMRGRGIKRVVKSEKGAENVVIKLVDAATSHIIRLLELSLMQTLPSATPVDLGTARSGWTPNIGSPVTERIQAKANDDETRAAAAQRLKANASRGAKVAAKYRVRQGEIFISNPVPWIIPLNEGSSAQAPAMFVQKAIAASTAAILRLSK